MRQSKIFWLFVIIFLFIFAVSYFLAEPTGQEEMKISTSYNADPKGVRAFYTLLSRLGYNTDRLIKPYTHLPKNADMLVIVQPTFEIEEQEIDALNRWICSGGIVLFLSDNLDGVPAAFGCSEQLGSGKVYAINKRSKITNEGMRKHENAVELLKIISKHASRGDIILFDEYHHGIEGSPLVLGGRVKVALGILIVTALLLAYTCGRRFGAVRDVAKTEHVRPGYEYVESVGRLYQKANAGDVAIQILCESFRRALGSRLGISNSASANELLRSVGSRYGSESSERVKAVLARCDRFSAGEKPSEAEVVKITRELRALEEEFALGRNHV